MEFIQNSADSIQKQIDAANHSGTNKAKIRGFDNNPNFIINDSNLDIDKVLKN